jgi:hypothetical protein
LKREFGFDVVIPETGKQMRKVISKYLRKSEVRIIAGGGVGTLNAVATAVVKQRANRRAWSNPSKVLVQKINCRGGKNGRNHNR